MKTILRFLFLIVITTSLGVTAQNFGTFASAVWLTNCEQSNFFNTTGEGASLIGPESNVFTNTNFGVFRQNSGQLIFRGGEVKTFKTPSGNACSVRINYRIYLNSATPGSFSTIDFPFFNDCNTDISEFPSGGPCSAGDQKWQRVIPNGATTPFAPVDLTIRPPGDYVLEVYYDVTGSNNSSSACDETIFLNNNGQNYRAFFSIRPTPTFTFTNPTTCGGTDGTINLSGLQPNATYSFNFNNNGTPSGNLFITPTAMGTHTIQNLTQGTYSNFNLLINGCTTTVNTAITLIDPSVEAPLSGGNQTVCETNPMPLLTATATAPSGSVVVWFDAPTGGNVVDNPNWNEVGIVTYYAESQDSTLNCVSPNRTAVTLTIEPAPEAPTGVSPQLFCTDATVVLTLQDLQASGQTIQWYASETEATPLPANTPIQTGSYFATQTIGNCESLTRLEIQVTVDTLIDPQFVFGNAIDICEEDITVIALPTISENNITGTWEPEVVNTTVSGTYVFTPDPGLCANPFELTVTVIPGLTPEFDFGTTINLCSDDSAPELPNVAQNGVTGTWSPSTINNTQSGSYTFTPEVGLCATPFTLQVDIIPALNPEFEFGNTINLCSGDSAPELPNVAQNGITGIWSPSTINNTQSGSYTFVPEIGLCATNFILEVNVNPLSEAPVVVGSQSFCTIATVVFTLQNLEVSGTNLLWYADQGLTNPLPANTTLANNTTYYVTQNTNGCQSPPAAILVQLNAPVNPQFGFANELVLCADETAPVLPGTSLNNVIGSWQPSVIIPNQDGIYTFTPTEGSCATTFVLNVSVLTPIDFTMEWACENENYILSVPNAPDNSSIEWTNSNGMTVGNNSSTFNVTQHLAGQSGNATLPLTFFATVTDINGCSVTQSFIIEAVYCGIQRGISPNGDNLNDFFDLQLLNVKRLSIFNRYGVKVYEKENYTREWVGQTSDGKELPTATYYYVIEFRNGESVTGWIYVQRENGS
ncbi:MAG: gliding motility-associated C-terminal domain-containing protein [Flavobacterium sp.]